MKRILVALLALLTVLSCFAVPVSAEEPVVTDEVKNEVKDNPSSFTLVGTPDLPPICNQGEVGCCASCAITYTQYTNAVSKYIRKYHPEITFEPATGELKYLFAPKWTFGFSGSGTAWVYDILIDHGAVTMDVSSFFLHPKNGSFLVHHPTNKKLLSDPVAWDITKTQMEEAMRFRLNSFEQIWVGGSHDLGKVDGKLQLTTTEDGQALIAKIKDAINAGNVVVTGGLSSVWKYSNTKDEATGKMLGTMVDEGTLGKKTDAALIYSRGEMAGGHQLSIVGYDDDIAFEVNGVTLKGAFQVSNSWGTTWMNEGYVWLMYDALNELSEYEELNFEDRTISMDQFCFTNWETDIIDVMPEIFVEAEVSAKNRESISIQPVTKNIETNAVSTRVPKIFSYSRFHPDYDELDDGGYFNINGEKNGEEAKGVFAFRYGELINSADDIKNNTFGVRVTSKGGAVTVHSLRLKNSRGEVIAEIDIPKEGEKVSSVKNYYFDAEFCKVTFKQDAPAEGSSYEEIDAYYALGSKVALNITVDEGYTDANAKVVTADGTAIEKNEQGVYELTVSGDTVISYSGIEKDTPVEPSEPEDSSKDQPSAPAESTPEFSEDGKQPAPGNDGPAIGVIVGVAIGGVVLAVAIVAVILVIKKRK